MQYIHAIGCRHCTSAIRWRDTVAKRIQNGYKDFDISQLDQIKVFLCKDNQVNLPFSCIQIDLLWVRSSFCTFTSVVRNIHYKIR